MTVASQVIFSEIEKIAPKYLAEDWDNVGLLVGDPAQDVERALVTLDCTPAVVEEAINKGVNLILAHHPLIFSPLKQIRIDLPGQALVTKLIRYNISFYAAHTNLDSSPLGGNAILADNLALEERQFLLPGYKEQMFKLAVFVPEEYAVPVRDAMTRAGAGGIGAYNECFFQTPGKGTFRPLEGANPFIGQTGVLEQVQEVKLETITPASSIDRVIRAMRKAHPYEVPAYDVIPTQNPGVEYGLGVIGYLPAETALGELVHKIKKMLGGCNLRVAGELNQKIKKAAVCTGSGGSLVKKAAAKGAGVLIAGDISHHEALDALAAGMAIIDPGHFATEWFMMERLCEYLMEKMAKDKRQVELILSAVKTEPFKFL